jgi:hypothetical protein
MRLPDCRLACSDSSLNLMAAPCRGRSGDQSDICRVSANIGAREKRVYPAEYAESGHRKPKWVAPGAARHICVIKQIAGRGGSGWVGRDICSPWCLTSATSPLTLKRSGCSTSSFEPNVASPARTVNGIARAASRINHRRITQSYVSTCDIVEWHSTRAALTRERHCPCRIGCRATTVARRSK